jgi:hypothetical protein
VETLKRIGDKYIKEGQRERKKEIKEKRAERYNHHKRR